MLHKYQEAPRIVTESIGGAQIDSLEFRGRKSLIKFHRFSGCPIAQCQVGEFISRQRELNAAGLETIVFMHCRGSKIIPRYNDAPGLHIIADPQKKYYRLFAAEFRLSKLFSFKSWGSTFKSIFKGYLPLFNRFGGGIAGVPSDFLIDENGVIIAIHYGKHFGDSWSVSEVLNKLSNADR